jgi:uncharacterized membrane protein
LEGIEDPGFLSGEISFNFIADHLKEEERLLGTLKVLTDETTAGLGDLTEVNEDRMCHRV